MREKVEAALERIRPSLQADGGDVKLIDINDGVVSVRLTGGCSSCPMSAMTLKHGIEREELNLSVGRAEARRDEKRCNRPRISLLLA